MRGITKKYFALLRWRFKILQPHVLLSGCVLYKVLGAFSYLKTFLLFFKVLGKKVQDEIREFSFLNSNTKKHKYMKTKNQICISLKIFLFLIYFIRNKRRCIKLTYSLKTSNIFFHTLFPLVQRNLI